MFLLQDYDYHLPEKLIAQNPLPRREQSRLLFMNRKTGRLSHHIFYELYDLLLPSDVMVINNTQVIPARLIGKKDSGGRAEILILDYVDGRKRHSRENRLSFNCLIKASKRPKIGSAIIFDRDLAAEILSFKDDIYTVKFACNGDFEDLLYQIGQVPLPPYIKRNPGDDSSWNDRASYQTVYASQKGAVAAPTAGFHFSEKFLEKIILKGVQVVEITLHVGYGTFLPVRVSDIRNHKMHREWYAISQKAADTINQAKANGYRIITVGTTCVRTLEHACDNRGKIAGCDGPCDLFIYPGYRFKMVDAMITNFHLPRSTLLMLISAFAGRTQVLKAYQEAIRKRYRFYSYGDAMFIA